MVRLDALLDSWITIRADAAQAVEDFAGEDLDYRPTPELMSFRDIARHILEAGKAISGLLIDGETTMTGPEFREKIKKYYPVLPAEMTAADLAAGLRAATEEDCARLGAQSPEFYATLITRFDGLQVTRLEMLQWLKEHELTHRAQLFLYMRLKGLVPPTTRRRMAKK